MSKTYPTLFGVLLTALAGQALADDGPSVACANLRQAIQVQLTGLSILQAQAGDDFQLPVSISIANFNALQEWNGTTILDLTLRNDIAGSATMTTVLPLQRDGRVVPLPASLAAATGSAMVGDYRLIAVLNAYGSQSDSARPGELCHKEFDTGLTVRVANSSANADITPPVILSAAFDQSSYTIFERANLSITVDDQSHICYFDAFCGIDLPPFMVTVKNEATGEKHTYEVGSLDGRRLEDGTLNLRLDLNDFDYPLDIGTYVLTFLPLVDVHGNFTRDLPATAQARFTMSGN